MGRSFKEAKVWRRSQEIFLVTRQVHCYNFTPSPAVTAPHSLICGHSKKTAWTVITEHFDLLSLVGEDVSMLTPSHPEKSLLVKCIRHWRTHLTWLVSCYLFTSVAQKRLARLATRSSNTWRDDNTKQRCGARRAFRDRCFRTQRRQTGP